MNNPYKIEIVGTGADGKRIYGMVYKAKNLHHIGFPDSWGTRQHATKYMVTQRLFVPWNEWKSCKSDFQ